MDFVVGESGDVMPMIWNSIFADRYEQLREMCRKARPEEYREYLKIVPINPFYKNDWKPPRMVYFYIMDEMMASGNYDDIFDALYYIAHYKGGADDEDEEILGN
jgi:hypothetical protein